MFSATKNAHAVGKPVVVGRVNTDALPPLSLSLALNVTSANSNGDTVDESNLNTYIHTCYMLYIHT